MGRNATKQVVIIAACTFLYFTAYGATIGMFVELLIHREVVLESAGSSAGADPPDSATGLAASWLEYYTVAQGVASLISTPVLAMVSDSFGRKPALQLAIISGLLAALAVLLIPWSVKTAAMSDTWMLMATAAAYLGGGIYGIIGVTFAAAADISLHFTPAARTRFFAALESCIWTGITLGPVSGGLANQFLGSQLCFLLPSCLCGVALVLACFFEDTLHEERRVEFSWSGANAFSMVGMLLSRTNSKWLAGVLFFCLSAQTGVVVVQPFFIEDVFGKGALSLGFLQSTMFGSSAVGLLALMPVLTLGLRARWIMQLSCCCLFVSILLTSLVRTQWQLYAVTAGYLFNALYFPALRSVVASEFGPTKHGQALGAIATLQQICQLIAPSVFVSIYKHAGRWGAFPVEHEANPRDRWPLLVCAALALVGVVLCAAMPKIKAPSLVADSAASPARDRGRDGSNAFTPPSRGSLAIQGRSQGVEGGTAAERESLLPPVFSAQKLSDRIASAEDLSLSSGSVNTLY